MPGYVGTYMNLGKRPGGRNFDVPGRRATYLIATDRVGAEVASEIIVDNGHVGMVVGRSASQDRWPNVGARLGEYD